MSERRTAKERLEDAVQWGERLDDHLRGVGWEKFVTSTLLQDAASKCAEAIGVAAGELLKLDPALDDAHPDLQLRLAYLSRNRLSHGYHVIDLSVLWTTASVDIPRTVAAVRSILATRYPVRT
jgi:uncharacterized protein with HEPN domain